MRLRFQLGIWAAVMAASTLAIALTGTASAQSDLPFRDPKLSDDARISDLLGRLTLDEKVLLMSDHPKIPRLGIVFSGQVDEPSITTGTDTVSITLSLESPMINHERASQRRYTANDQHANGYPDDIAFNWVELLNDIALQWG